VSDDELAAELGLGPDERPAWLTRVPPELRAQIVSLRAQRRRELADAIDRALDHVPRLLRGALKKVMFG
jgi:hypothetical protein